MKKIAVIGSCVADVIIQIPHLPCRQEDINITSQKLSLGGCAFNAAHMLKLFQVPYLLCTPVGQGIYGDFVKKQLKLHDAVSFFPEAKEDNGCCYCFVEDDGERTFLSHHGAEYHFQDEWFTLLDQETIDIVYICGLEIEENSGQYIIDYLKRHPDLSVYFACGPRIHMIDKEKLNALFDLHCILHLNEAEAYVLSGKNKIEDAAKTLYEKTMAPIIITLGDQGCYYYQDNEEYRIPTIKRTPVDTIGAGDAHIGTIMALHALGYSSRFAIEAANRISGAIIETSGSLLTQDQFAACMNTLIPLPEKSALFSENQSNAADIDIPMQIQYKDTKTH